MTILDSFVFDGRSERGSHYPWAEWLDGRIRQLSASDFPLGRVPKAFNNAVRLQAKKRGLSVRIQKHGDGVVIQAFKPGDATTEPASAPPRKKRK